MKKSISKKILFLLPVVAITASPFCLLTSCNDNDTKICITIDAVEGTIDNLPSKELEIKSGSKWSEVKQYIHDAVPTSLNKKFKEWTLNGNTIDENYTFNDPVTIKAKYTDADVTVTFNCDGGQVFGYEIIPYPIEYGTKWSEISSYVVDPVYKDKTKKFDYWTVNNERIQDTYIFEKPIILTAMYKSEAPETITLSYDCKGGTISGIETGSFDITVGTTWGMLKKYAVDPTPPVGKRFTIWSLNGSKETISDGYIFKANDTLTANYDDAEITLKLDANGGSIVGRSTFAIAYNAKWSAVKLLIQDPNAPTHKIFSYWTADGVNPLVDGDAFTKDITIKAIYRNDNKVILSWDANGGSCEGETKGSFSLNKGCTWKKLKDFSDTPDAPTGKKFVCWSINGQTTPITDEYTFNDDVLIKATYEIEDVAVSIDCNGGSIFEEEILNFNVQYGTQWTEVKQYIPDPIPADPEIESFDHWEINESKIPTYYTFTSPVTIKAVYKNVVPDIIKVKWTTSNCYIKDESGVKHYFGDFQIIKNTTWAEIKQFIPTPEGDIGYKFNKWTVNGKDLIDSFVFDRENIEIKAIADDANINITFDCNGGLIGGKEIMTIPFGYGIELRNLDIPDPVIDDETKYFAGWTFDGETVLEPEYKFEDNVTIKAKWEENKLFCYDSWFNVCKYANLGFDELKKHYGLDSFIGLQRMITLNGLEHRVRVIGETHDELANGTGKAALTFELVDVVSDTNGTGIEATVFDLEKGQSSQDMLHTNLMDILNSSSVVVWNNNYSGKSCLTMLSQENSGLTVKTVKKQVATTNAMPNHFSLESYETKLFALTHAEMGAEDDKKAMVEGKPYSYWITHTTREDREKRDIYYRNTHTLSSFYWGYYLFSPDISVVGAQWASNIWDIDLSWDINCETEDFFAKPISFAFCI